MLNEIRHKGEILYIPTYYIGYLNWKIKRERKQIRSSEGWV